MYDCSRYNKNMKEKEKAHKTDTMLFTNACYFQSKILAHSSKNLSNSNENSELILLKKILNFVNTASTFLRVY